MPDTPSRTRTARQRAATGKAVDLGSASASTAPDLPHERDQSVGMTGGVPSQRVQQGGRDLKRGLQDTSRAPEADTAYRQLKK